ncbi:ParB N-terminal domain-containing protein [Ralstonia solanacearum]|uniref:ParB N-terminal domain-containing protein n=2 Tax=Ralstonia solanacearum TaxID=305 RepID=A0AAW5ZT01_RALSL|nr:ParB N-terminal domain-containing protein [Ralstonia solanacearum]AST34377.2 ParB N-terminal domain-containing protein [Ralstonia solanacearum]MBB6592690.1 ParB N-terminal domain-containing protein [Ralstonia solanacearum]MBB6596914.1 ParB N-terminal domain-containing protein [Ralstonia solanacearum]MBT1539479.1 ParB N-terminal domain-containing protein [Ralstonia solanacearum]MDB0510307.1 ParB N-terminal domain-containing protein [Ralstonia solanacearum]
MHADLSYCVALRPTAFFKPSEEVDADHVRRLADTIRATGLWTTPIPIERETGIVMDGNHRMRAAALLGLHHLPCVLLDYADPRVSVTHWGSGAPFSVAGIRQRIVAERRLFPYKTTRHRFAPALPSTEIPLTVLGTAHGVRIAALA